MSEILQNALFQRLAKKAQQHLVQLLAAEISRITSFCSSLIQFSPLPFDRGTLRDAIQTPDRSTATSLSSLKERNLSNAAILLNGNFNHHLDIEAELRELYSVCERSTRIVVVAYNPYMRWLFSLATKSGVRAGDAPCTFVTETDLTNLCKLTHFEVVRLRSVGFFPFPIPLLSDLINALCPALPIISWFGICSVATLRPIKQSTTAPTVAVIIPARNEKGTIEAAVERMPLFGGNKPEIIFVEGHSKDETWNEIIRVSEKYKNQFTIKALQQTGKGKVDAVRCGCTVVSADLIMILDADLTMPPEHLTRFYDAYTAGLADFINGSRLLYPMGGAAMKFLNKLGNVFFAKALSVVLQTKIADSLCGTKVFAKKDYERFTAWRAQFGDFDPLGDFELLYPAAVLGVGIVDVPVRYRDRVYGTTNIRRFYHGALLLKMTLIGFFKITCGEYGTKRTPR